MKLFEIVKILEEIAPPIYAATGDKIGLQVGDPDADVRQVLVTLDVTQGVVSEAVRRSADLLVSHHPLIYNPLANLRSDLYPQSLVCALVKGGVSHFAMHTNFDAAEGGINDVLAEKLGVMDTSVIEPTYTEKLFKLVTFVPLGSVESVREALADAGAGAIGKYTHCSFQSQGTGTFLPTSGADPYIGEVGELERSHEYKLEVIVPEAVLHGAVSAMIAAHPYEEVAYDVYPLKNAGAVKGIGLHGILRKPMTFDGFCEMVKDVLSVEDARISGDPESRVEKVAVVGGAGGSMIDMVSRTGVDTYVTGDVNHHQLLQARALGLNVIDATHLRTERPGMVSLTPKLRELLSDEGVSVEYVDDITLADA